jgi:hypothetical protein
MARKVHVIQPGANFAIERMKRPAALQLIKQRTAYWLIENETLQLLRPGENPPRDPSTTPWRYIPEEMPPLEIPGVIFRGPVPDPPFVPLFPSSL